MLSIRFTRIPIPIMVIALITAFTVTVPGPTLAEPVEGVYVTMMPSANASTYYRVDPLPTTPTSCYEIEVAEDYVCVVMRTADEFSILRETRKAIEPTAQLR